MKKEKTDTFEQFTQIVMFDILTSIRRIGVGSYQEGQ
jgi:hypothetical protein